MFKFGKKSDMAKVQAYIAKNGESGLTRHYGAVNIVEGIESKTGVKITETQAVELVQNYRQSRGWSPRSLESFYPADGEE